MQVSIQTTQNVLIEQDKAGVGSRILAFFIDLMIFIAYSVGIFYLLEAFSYFDSQWVNLLFYFPVFFYDLYMEILNNGQSVGKKALGIRVVRLDGGPPTIGGYILRWILRPIDVIFSGAVAIICIGMTENGQRLGDLAAGTTVVKVKKTEKVSRLQLVEKMEENYEPMFPEVKILSDKDVAIIKESLRMRADFSNSMPVILLTDKVKEKLNIESDLEPVPFLYTILRDYTYYITR
jgi:uncharacterized RDD family membrane protein YckC